MTQENRCPTCQSPLYFAPDGRSRLCERCGYRQPIQRKQPFSVRELEGLQTLRSQHEHLDETRDRSSARIRLSEGKTALHENRPVDAYFALSFLLKARSTEAERAEAWFLLSQLFDEDADKRRCLEHALALQPKLTPARRALAMLEGRLSPQEIVDPNTIRSQQEAAAKAAAETAVAEQFACPRCAGAMRFSAERSAFVCEFCGLTQGMAATGKRQPEARFGQGAFEQDFVAALATAKGHLQPVNLRAFQCQGCATEFMLAPETVSVTCPYCQSVYVTAVAETAEIMPPHAMLPFTITQDAAEAGLRRWLKRQRLRPTRIAPLHGVYRPLWTFDISGEVAWRGQEKRGNEWVAVTGVKLIFHNDALVPGSQRASDNVQRAFHNFKLAALQPYDPRYLANWPAERYTLPLADASLQGRKLVLQELRRHPHKLTSITRDVRNVQIRRPNLFVESFKLLLLPLWIGHYRTPEAEYEVVVNGQTGEIAGERPSGIFSKVSSWLQGK